MLFARLVKVDTIEGIAYATAAAEVPDKSGEIFDYTSSKPHFEAWSDGIAKATDGKSFGNVREMHGPSAVGKITSIAFDDPGKKIDVAIKIIDKSTLEKLAEGVLTGVSIGGSYAKRWPDEVDGKKLTRYTAVPTELSVVDNPCMPTATFTCVKSDGTEELRKFHAPTPEPTPSAATEPTPELAQVWQAKDGKTFGKKADAEAHNSALAKAAEVAATPAGKLVAEFEALKADVAKMGDPAATVAKKDFSDDERKAMAEKGEALPDGSYPIANKSDLENAIQSFGRAKNKKAVKAHIKTRAKALSAEDALPDSWKDGADKAVVAAELRKGLDTVARFACLLQELAWLQQSTEYEAEYEGDSSTVPASLKTHLAPLCADLRAMTEEETNELFTLPEMLEYGETLEMSVGAGALVKMLGDKCPAALTKAAARHGDEDAKHLANAHDSLSAMGFGKCAGMGKASSRFKADDAKNLQKAHDCLTKAGAPCSGKDMPAGDDTKDDDEPAEKMAKMATALEASNAKNEALEKTMGELTAGFAEMRAQVAKFAKSPMPRPHERVQTHTVSKGAPEPTDADDISAKVAHLPPEQRNAALVEYAMSLPKQITR